MTQMTDSNNPKKQQIAESIRINKILEDADKVRKAGLYNTTVSGAPIISGSESDRDEKDRRHTFDATRKVEGRDAYYFFPESYNALRKELAEHWPELWATVGWRMANRAEEFVEQMNAALDVAVVFDTEKVDFISSTYLKLLRKKRGVSS